MAQKTFKRIERKYVIDEKQKEALIDLAAPYVSFDAYCQNRENYWVQNIYYDTINNSLISHSINRPSFKIKYRVRHYVGGQHYFLEAKQKTSGIVSKRRVALTKEEYNEFITSQKLPVRNDYLEKQIIEEFNYFLSHYPLFPCLYLSYRRVAFFSKDDPELRITIDNHIRGSRTNFTWDQTNPDIDILDNNYYVLEIKYNQNYPLWLSKILANLKIFHTSFSKYGEEYKNFIKGEH